MLLVLARELRHPLSSLDLRESYLACLNSNTEQYDKGLCLKNLSVQATKKSSVPEVVVAMESIKDSQQLQWCHEFMHYVGWSVYDQSGDLFTAFNEASEKCDSGMYHGIVERYIEKASLAFNAEEFGQAVANACEGSLKARTLPQAMKGLCQHGLGHGFMLITDNNLNEALHLCDLVKGSERSCYSGAFMENVQSKQVGRMASHPSLFSYDTKTPDFPCNKLDERYLDFCYVFKGVSNVVLSNGDFRKSFEQCLDVRPDYQERCLYGVGTDIPGPHWSTTEAAKHCDSALKMDKRAYPQCVLGGMSFLMQINLGNPDAAVEYCNVIRKEYKETCYKAAGISFRDWVSPQESLEYKCGKFLDPRAQEICEE